MRLNLYFIIIFFLLSGCNDIKTQELKNFSSKQIEARIVKNKSTKAEIESIFGKTKDLDFDKNGKEKWIYISQVRSKNPLYSISLWSILFGKYVVEHKLEIIFEHDVVSSYTLTTLNRKTSISVF